MRRTHFPELDAQITQQIFDAGPVGMALATRDGRILRANHAFCKFLGYSERELRGMTIQQITHPDDWKASASRIRRVWSDASNTGRIEKRYLHKSGDIVWGQVRARAIPNKQGKIGFHVAIVTDISERKRREGALQEFEARYRTLFEQAADAIVVFDPDTTAIVDFNDAACRQLGYTREEFAKLKVSDFDVVESPNEVKRHSRQVVSDGASVFETKHRTKTGAVLDVEIRPKAIHLGGRVLIQGVWRDITERKRAAEALQEIQAQLKQTHDQLQATLNALPDILFEVDREGRIFDYRAPDERLLYVPPGQFIGRTFAEVLPPDVGRLCKEAIAQASAEGYSRGLSYPLKTPKGQGWFELSVSRKSDAGTPGGRFIVLVRDITERKEAKEALQKAHDELEQKVKDRTAKLTALAVQLDQTEEKERRRMAQILHEELQQVLVGARFTLKALKEHASEKERQKTVRHVDGLLDKAHQTMRSLCLDLHPPVLFDAGIDAALRWLANDMRQKFGLNVKVEINAAVESPAAFLSSFIFQAVREMLFNVVKHAGVKSARVRLSSVDADRMLVEVKDRGVGFDPSRSNLNSFGLFGIQERVDFIGGQMKMVSAPGKGATIRLTLPRL